MTSKDSFKPLIEDVWSQYSLCESLQFVVKPSIPILFFGDHKRYSTSHTKIVTLGLNPSNREFPSGNSFLRFPQAETFLKGDVNCDSYKQTLSDYFRVNPYSGWFSSYEPILNGMGSSYYETEQNTALHTDICTPFATNPTWSHLQMEEKNALSKQGFLLWRNLISVLEPNVILISVAQRYIEDLELTEPWKTIYTIERKRPYSIKISWTKLANGKKVLLVFGNAAQKPFGSVSNIDKKKIGQKIMEELLIAGHPL